MIFKSGNIPWSNGKKLYYVTQRNLINNPMKNIPSELNPSKRPDVRLKISEKLKGRKITWNNKISKTRKKLFIEGKLKPINPKGTTFPEEVKIKMRINNWSRRGFNHPLLGKHQSKSMRMKVSGPNNYGWRGGTHFEPYSFQFNKLLKEKIRCRDNNVCRICEINKEQNKRELDVHHIDYDKKNCNEDNLITLCRKHHTLMRLNRNWWMLYFANKERI